MPTKAELEQKIKHAQHRAFIARMYFLVIGIAGGWIACYIYVIHFGGTFPPTGTFSAFLKQSWGLMLPVAIPIIQALISSYINRKKRESD